MSVVVRWLGGRSWACRQHARKINSSFWCVRERRGRRAGRRGGRRRRRAEAAALRAPAPALRSAVRRVLAVPRPRTGPRRARTEASWRRPRYVNRRWRVGVGRQRARHCAAAAACAACWRTRLRRRPAGFVISPGELWRHETSLTWVRDGLRQDACAAAAAAPDLSTSAMTCSSLLNNHQW